MGVPGDTGTDRCCQCQDRQQHGRDSEESSHNMVGALKEEPGPAEGEVSQYKPIVRLRFTGRRQERAGNGMSGYQYPLM